MERVADNGMLVLSSAPTAWSRYALVGVKWLLFATALWIVLVPLKYCLACSLGGGHWAAALLISVSATLIFAFFWVDRALNRKKRKVGLA